MRLALSWMLGCTLYASSPSPWGVGGYLSTVASKDTLSLEEIALIGYSEWDRTDLLVELEAPNLYAQAWGSEATYYHTFHTERLYLKHAWDDTTSIQVGKFNSPVGFWNRMPINVLRDTTSNPQFVERFFPKLTSGIALESHDEYDLIATIQANRDIDIGYNNLDAHQHYTLSLAAKFEPLQWQMGVGYFQLFREEVAYGFGAIRVQEGGAYWLAEILAEHDTQQWSYDGYVQGLYPCTPMHAVVGRVEWMSDHDITELIAVGGYLYRPWESGAFKIEYEWHEHLAQSRWLASVSFLF